MSYDEEFPEYPSPRQLKLKTYRDVLIKYLIKKVEMEDWHGVRDVCVDLEILDTKLTLLEELE